MPALTVRVATRADGDRLPPLFDALAHPATVSQLRVRLARLCSDPVYEAWVAADQTGLLVAFAAGHLFFPVEDDTPAAQLIALVAASTARGQGVGTMLVRRFESWAVQNGATRAVLTSSLERADAHAFYLGQGYIASGARFSKTLSSPAEVLQATVL
jgi:GNAT superfamily N-acetyltransferase